LVDILNAMSRKNANTFASDYEKRENLAQGAIDKLIESFTNME
jgi:hypothetical protein